MSGFAALAEQRAWIESWERVLTEREACLLVPM